MMLEKIAIVAGLGLALSTAVEAQTPRHSHDGALLELKGTLGLSYMVSHDLGVVEHMSDRVAVMYLGRIVETGDWREIFERPHPDRGHPRSATSPPRATFSPPQRAGFPIRSIRPTDVRSVRVVATPKPYFSARPCRRWKRDPTGTRYGAGERMRLPALHFRRHEPIRETSRLRP